MILLRDCAVSLLYSSSIVIRICDSVTLCDIQFTDLFIYLQLCDVATTFQH